MYMYMYMYVCIYIYIYQRSLRRIHARHVVLIRSSSRRVACANVPAGRFYSEAAGTIDGLVADVSTWAHGGSREVMINYTIAQIGANRIQYHSSHVMRMNMHDT